jgi:glycine cleavage system H lipoate-binding protein
LGITDYAQKALGDVVFVEVVDAGTQLTGKSNHHYHHYLNL